MKKIILLALFFIGVTQAQAIVDIQPKKQKVSAQEKIKQFQTMKADKIVDSILSSLENSKLPIKIDYVTSLLSIKKGKTPETILYTYGIDKKQLIIKFKEVFGEEKMKKFNFKKFDKDFTNKIVYINTMQTCSNRIFKIIIDKGVVFEYKYSYNTEKSPLIDFTVAKKDCENFSKEMQKIRNLKSLPVSKDTNSTK